MAPLYGVEPSQNSENKSDREKRHGVLRRARVELVSQPDDYQQYNDTRRSVIEKRAELQIHAVDLCPSSSNDEPCLKITTAQVATQERKKC